MKGLLKKRFTAFLCAAAVMLAPAPLCVPAMADSEPDAVLDASGETENTGDNTAESSENINEPTYSDENIQPVYMFTLPENMRASVITPTVDFLLSEDESESDVYDELEAIFAEFSRIGLNTVIINTVCGNNSYYSIDMNSSGAPDPTALAMSVAYNYGISPYLVLDLSHLLLDSGESPSRIDALVSRVHRFAMKYPCDGIILDDYYVRRGLESFAGYMEDGSGVGYVNWLYDTADQLFSTAADVIRRTSNSIAVGFMINDMWANSSVNSEGSVTEDTFQALYDGHCDTRSFIESGYVDFALVRAYGSLTSASLPFEEVTGWWGSLASQHGIPMYVVHHNEYIGTQTAGWNAEDQLLKQLTAAKKLDCYCGSVFNSYERLTQNPLGTTSTLTSYYEGQINEETLGSDLKMVSPAKLSFTTSEPTVTFMGSFDSNFPVYFNNSPIKLNDAGNFYFSRDLKVGVNTFTISHKSKTYTYKIERKIIVMKTIAEAISEGKALRVEGGTKIKLTVTAYEGSSVYGVINGTTVPMSAADIKTDDEDVNSSYVRYTGTYTVPAGIIGQKQELGTIMIYGSNSGYSMEVRGATVTINALPEPVVEKKASMLDADSVGSGEVIGTLEAPQDPSGSVTYVKISSDYTMVYDGKTADDIPSPMFCQLPAGTIDKYKSTSGNYYLTASGKRIPASASTLAEGTGIEKNALIVRSVGTSNGESYIKIGMDYRTSFNVRLVGNSYYTAWEGDYNVNSFTATHVYITFEDVTSVTKLPSFENNMVFRSGKWDTVTEDNGTKFRLILELRQPGVYFGQGAHYDNNGDLVMTFKVPTNLLSGLTVVVDPGHGYGKFADKYDPGAVGEVIEQEVVLAIAKELTSQLSAAGANVVRLKTENPEPFLLTKRRPIVARGYGCDIYLSIHANKASPESGARGAEVYYFTSYSQPLAACISSSIASYFTNYVYSDGASKNRGAKYSYFDVTLQQDFPSVLIETAFVSEMQDAMALASPTHQAGIAKAIVSGLKNYLARSSISYASEGRTDAASPADEPENTADDEPADEPDNEPEDDEPNEPDEPDGSDGPGEPDEPEEQPGGDEPDEPDDEPNEPNETSEPDETSEPTDDPQDEPNGWLSSPDGTQAAETSDAPAETSVPEDTAVPEETTVPEGSEPEETTSGNGWLNGGIPVLETANRRGR